VGSSDVLVNCGAMDRLIGQSGLNRCRSSLPVGHYTSFDGPKSLSSPKARETPHHMARCQAFSKRRLELHRCGGQVSACGCLLLSPKRDGHAPAATAPTVVSRMLLVTDSRGRMVHHRPAGNLTADNIQHDRQVEKASSGWDVGDVRRPEPVQRTSRELAIDPIRRHTNIPPRRPRHVLPLPPDCDG
jgi:hypothetical protein